MGSFTGLAPAGFPNVALSNFAKEFRNNAFVGDILCPTVPVSHQSFPYVIWNRDDFRVPGSTLRAPGDGATTIRRSYSTDSFFCRSHALKGSVPFESEAYGAGLGFSTRQRLTKDLSNRIRLAREAEIAAMALSIANFPNGVTLTTTALWDSYITDPTKATESTVTSNPIADIELAKETLRQSGIMDNEMVLVLSSPVVRVLVNHPKIVDRFKYTNTMGVIDLDKLASVFGVKCVRGGAVKLSQNNAASWVWGSAAFLGYAQTSPSLDDVSCMKTFVWAGGKGPNGEDIPAAPGTVDGYGVLEWLDPDQDKKTFWQSVDWYYDLKVTAQETGYPILSAVSDETMAAVAGDIEG